jgi:hypothetical protein
VTLALRRRPSPAFIGLAETLAVFDAILASIEFPN